MAFLMRTGKAFVSLAPRNPAYLYNIVKNVSKHSPYLPGPYPKTAEERRLAAAKYGLCEEEYEPYPEEECLGDYPKLPDIGASSKDPYYPYDIPVLKRNFNEPVHFDFNLLTEDRLDPSERTLYNKWTYTLLCLSVIGLHFAIAYSTRNYLWFRPVLEKQLPTQSNDVHYTFES